MVNDLNLIIPKKEPDLRSIDKYDGNKKAIMWTIILIVFVAISIYGFIYTYNNYIKGHSSNTCKTEKECFLLAAKNCKVREYTTTTESLGFLTIYMSLKNKYTIEGLNDENKCVVTINTLDANLSYDKEKLIEYIDKPENKEKIYTQYALIESMDENSQINDNNMPDIDTAITDLKKLINNYYDTLDPEVLASMRSQEPALSKALTDRTENCIFEDYDKLSVFLENKIDGIMQDVSSKSHMNLGSETYNTTDTYDGGVCTSN